MIEKITSWYIYSSLHIALCTTSLVLSSYWLCEQEVDYSYLLFSGFATLLLYSLHRIIGYHKHAKNQQTKRFKWYQKHNNWVHILLIISVISCFGLFFTLKRIQQIIIVIMSIPSMAYILPLFRTKRLRDIAYVKIFIVALTWAGVISIVPAYERSLNEIIYFFLEKTSFILAITLPFDFRDKELDRANEVKTIANTFSKNIDLLIILSFVASILCTVLNPLYTIEWKLSISLIYVVIGCITIWANKQKDDFYISGIIDGTMILFTLSIYIIQYGTF